MSMHYDYVGDGTAVSKANLKQENVVLRDVLQLAAAEIATRRAYPGASVGVLDGVPAVTG